MTTDRDRTLIRLAGFLRLEAWMVQIARMVPIVALLGALAFQLHSYGPTVEDPDPDGYVSYASGLSQSWSIQEHRRLPGYPFILAVADSLGAGVIAVKMFWVHLLATVAFAGATAFLIWRLLGYAVAVAYLLLLACNSYFARASVVMLADLPLVLFFYLTCAAGVGFLRSSKRRGGLFAALFFLGSGASVAVHPSAHMLFQILIGCSLAALVWPTRPWAPSPRHTVAPLLILAVLAFASKELVMRNLQVDLAQDYLDLPQASASSSNYLKSWVGYRMLLCLPAPADADGVDRDIDARKAAAAERLGYPVEAVVPPGYYPEFLPLLDGRSVAIDRWHDRLREHPFDVLSCAARELRAKYHVMARNLTPFTSFDRDKTWITPDYPPNTGSHRDNLFWTTGINLSRLLPVDAPATAVAAAAAKEIARLALVLALSIGGLLMLNRLCPRAGVILVAALVVWLCALPLALPLETRYLMVFFPAIYAGQALMVVRLAASAWRRVRGTLAAAAGGRP